MDDSLVVCPFTSERGFGLFLGEPYARMVNRMLDEDYRLRGWDADGYPTEDRLTALDLP